MDPSNYGEWIPTHSLPILPTKPPLPIQSSIYFMFILINPKYGALPLVKNQSIVGIQRNLFTSLLSPSFLPPLPPFLSFSHLPLLLPLFPPTPPLSPPVSLSLHLFSSLECLFPLSFIPPSFLPFLSSLFSPSLLLSSLPYFQITQDRKSVV